jgi:hypothetical protein
MFRRDTVEERGRSQPSAGQDRELCPKLMHHIDEGLAGGYLVVHKKDAV